MICGTCQLWKPPAHNEAQAHIVTLTTNFVAPWARGHGLAKMLVEKAEEVARAEGFAVINLEVRETMSRAIEIYEALGYVRFGMHPYSVRLPDRSTREIIAPKSCPMAGPPLPKTARYRRSSNIPSPSLTTASKSSPFLQRGTQSLLMNKDEMK